MKVFDRSVEAEGDRGSTLFCFVLTLKIITTVKTLKDRKTTNDLRAAIGPPIAAWGVITVSIPVKGNHKEHELHILEKTDANCLLVLYSLQF